MLWRCKVCQWTSSSKVGLLRHYRLQHGPFTHSHTIPCPHYRCPCYFKTHGALRTHMSRNHLAEETLESGTVISFNCKICNTPHSSKKDYFQHLGQHLRSYETVECVFSGCDFKTNVYGTFVSHKSRKHNPHSSNDLKAEVLVISKSTQHSFVPDPHWEDSEEVQGETDDQIQDVPQTVVNKLALLLLKLESVYNVSSRCIDDLAGELKFISSLAAVQDVRNTVESNLRKNNCVLSEDTINEFVSELCKINPIKSALEVGGPLGSSFKRRLYFKDNLKVVEPVEYILDAAERKHYQYVLILQTLQQVLNSQHMNLERSQQSSEVPLTFKSFVNGRYFRENDFFAGDEIKISLILYVDDFEVCNPLGTSKKKHKITAVYWVLANLPPELRSALTSIHLAVLSKADDVKKFGYEVILEPLLNDLSTLEQEGIFIANYGKNIKGTVISVVADNLGAHAVGGLVENFTGDYICRFCLGRHAAFQEKEVRLGAFPPRTKMSYAVHVQTVKDNPTLTHSFGVKKVCPFTDKLKHFHFTTGYPPDIAHDLFEGVIPVELALCLSVLVKKKYFTLSSLNEAIALFPYKWSDKTNSPHAIPQNFAARRSVGGNMHENWALIRLLPFLIGSKIPVDEPAWQILMNLKDIVELVVSPVHTAESIGFLDSKISEHRHQFLELFPHERLLPKHHFLEHYSELIESFGPVVGLWTIRFESKHSFFKRVVRHTTNFKNVLMSLATRHQLMMAYHLHATSENTSLHVSKVSNMPLELLHEEVQQAIRNISDQTSVSLTTSVSYLGTTYRVGMIVPYGCTGGLPDFAEIMQIVVLDKSLSFIVKTFSSWYNEHLRSYCLQSSGDVQLVEHKALVDWYPLAGYCLGKNRFVTLKHHICCSY